MNYCTNYCDSKQLLHPNLCFFEKTRGKPTKKQGFSDSSEPLKKKKAKTLKKTRDSFEYQKSKEIRKSKEQKMRAATPLAESTPSPNSLSDTPCGIHPFSELLKNPDNPYSPNLGVKIHLPNSGGESSKITCFTVLFGAHSVNLGGEDFTPQIWGAWVFRE